MLIGELSKQTQLSLHTIRYYEKSGLIKGKRPTASNSNNYLDYDKDCVDRLLLIRDAKSVGFTLAEIKALVDVWFSNRISKSKKIDILNKKSLEIENKIKELNGIKKQIKDFIKVVEEDAC